MTRATQEAGTSLLSRAYQFLQELAGSGEVINGFTLFVPEKDLKELMSEKLGISPYKSTVLLRELQEMEIYRTESGGQGKPWKRYLKMDAAEMVASASGSNPPPDPPPPPSDPPADDGAEDVTEIDAEEMVALLMTAHATIETQAGQLEAVCSNLESAQAEAEQLRAEVESLRAQLEEERNAVKKQVFVVPAEVASLAKQLASATKESNDSQQ